MATDVGFGFTGDEQLKAQSKVNDTYMYIMGYRSTNMSELVEDWIGKLLHRPVRRISNR